MVTLYLYNPKQTVQAVKKDQRPSTTVYVDAQQIIYTHNFFHLIWMAQFIGKVQQMTYCMEKQLLTYFYNPVSQFTALGFLVDHLQSINSSNHSLKFSLCRHY